MTVSKKALHLALEEFGLSSRETSIYLYLLEHGDTKPYVIARDLQLPRATVYLTLQTLISHGIVSIFKKNNIAFYSPESPSRLVKIVEHKQELIASILPGLKELTKEKQYTPSVKLYTGKESIKYVFKSLYDDLEAKGIKQLYTISHPELQEYFPKYLPEVLAWKHKLKIHTCLIVPGETEKDMPQSYKPDTYRETRFLPKEFPFSGTLMIAAEKIAVFSLKDDMMYAVTIESPVMVQMLKQVFLFTWKMIERK